MRKRIYEKINISVLLSVIIAVASLLFLIKNFTLCRSIVERAALISSKTVLVGAYRSTVQEEETTGETEKSTDSTETAVTPQNTQKPDESTAEKTNTDNVDEDGFTAEPEDLKNLVLEYSKKSGSDKKDGAIKELTYTTSGVTDKYKNVRVKNINETKINIEKLLERKPDLKIEDKTKPSVLIFHTHTTEAYQILDRSFYAQGYVTRSTDPSKNMVRVGDAVCKQLEKAGYNVIHDTQIYDKKYNGAYDRSREQVQKYLKEYPSIQVVLDIHRDAIQYNDGTKVKPVTEIMGKKCAQMMIISGCQEAGNGITDFPDWEYNLVFALHLQKTLEDMFASITRPVYFCPRRYIMNESHCNLLIEMGSDANTLSEGVYAGKCLGTALTSLLEEYTT